MQFRKHWPLVILAGTALLLLSGCAWQASLAAGLITLAVLVIGACGASTPIESDGDADGDVDGDGDGDADSCGEGRCPDHMTCHDIRGVGPWCLPDVDEDGVIDAEDNCPWLDNPDQADADGDGRGSSCDSCERGSCSGTSCGTMEVDADGDGVPEVESSGYPGPPECGDNCPFVVNPDQSDRDSDNIGDACDLFPDEPDIMSPCGFPHQDSDADGIGDWGHCTSEPDDICPTTPSADSGDHDGDGTPDVCDPDGIPPVAALTPAARELLRLSVLERLHDRQVIGDETYQVAASGTVAA